MPNKIALSVVVITKNEGTRLADCLKSVDWADEVIVVDDKSADDTVAVARAHGAKVFERAMDIEGKHRNYAYSLANHDWVFSLDADERVTPELKQEIIETLKNNPSCNGYAVPRRNFVGNTWVRYGGMYPSAQLRLFRKGQFRYDEQAEVHPQAYMQDPRGTLKNDILHYTYRDFTDAIAKLRRMRTGVTNYRCPVHKERLLPRRKHDAFALLDEFFLGCPRWTPDGEGCNFVVKLKSAAQLAGFLASAGESVIIAR